MTHGQHSNHDTRIRAVKAVLKGQSVASVAKSHGRHRSAVHRWVQAYRSGRSAASLRTKSRSGRPRAITPEICKAVLRDILKPATSFGFETDFWTCRRLITHIKASYGVKVSQPTLWRQLTHARLSYQKPERRYFETDVRRQRAWIAEELPKICQTVKKYRAILYFEDESCVRLTPILGRTWAPVGKTPVQHVTGNRGSVAAISAVSNGGNLIFTLHRDKIRSAEIIQFLDQMLKHHHRRHLVVVMDQARPHIAKTVKDYIAKQRRLHVFYLPPRSPELNPDEKIWNHLKNEELKAHRAKTVDELEKLIRKKLRRLSQNQSLVRGIFFRCVVAELLN